MEIDDASANPFLRYRRALSSYETARRVGLSDTDFVGAVRALDDAVSSVEGHGFVVTPSRPVPELAAAIGTAADLWVKDDTGNVAGSHKGRHLFGLMVHLVIGERSRGASRSAPLAIASCGNAALAAGVVAAAVGRPLQVFIPPDADAVVVDRLVALDARIEVCRRRPDERGDPCYLRFREAVARGAVPFSCQGTDAPATIDGGRTLVWELGEALREPGGGPATLDRLYVQVGGGALASACSLALDDLVAWRWLERRPGLHLVQTTGAFPFVRAWDRATAGVLRGDGEGRRDDELGPDAVQERVERATRIGSLDATERERRLALIAASADQYMWAWEDEPHSIAHGILDDVTYDWLEPFRGMVRGGGWPTVVTDELLVAATDAVAGAAGISADATGAAAVAGVLADVLGGHGPVAGERVAVTVTGRRRTPAAMSALEQAVN